MTIERRVKKLERQAGGRVVLLFAERDDETKTEILERLQLELHPDDILVRLSPDDATL